MGITFGSAFRKTVGRILAVGVFNEGEYVDRSSFGIARSTKPSLSTQLNFVFEPLKDDGSPAAKKDGEPVKNQQEWIGLSSREDSTMAALIKHLEEIGAIDPTTVMAPKDFSTDEDFAMALANLVCNSMEGHTFVLEQQNVGKKIDKPTWMPIQIVPDTPDPAAVPPETPAAVPPETGGAATPKTNEAAAPSAQPPTSTQPT